MKPKLNKIQKATLRAIDSRMKKRVGESDLGRLYRGETLHMTVRARCYYPAGADENQASLYAQALGVTLEDAQARIESQRRILRDADQPDGFHLARAKTWVAEKEFSV